MNKTIKMLGRILTTIAFLLIFFILLELLRAYQTLSEFHTLVGWGFIFVLIAVMCWGIFPLIKSTFTYRKSIRVPNINKFGGVKSRKYYSSYRNYLEKYIVRLTKNPNVDENCKEVLLNEFIKIKLKKGFIPEKEIVINYEVNCINPVILNLDTKAEKILKNTVRDTMASITLSPFRSMDAVIILTRNLKMFNDLIKLYNQKPPLSFTLGYFKDVVKIIASVNILNYTGKFTEKLMKGIPVVNRIADDIIQGLGAGILTTSFGKATIQRCRAYGIWDENLEKSGFSKTSRDFYQFVKTIFISDIVPKFSNAWLSSWKTIVDYIPRKTKKAKLTN